MPGVAVALASSIVWAISLSLAARYLEASGAEGRLRLLARQEMLRYAVGLIAGFTVSAVHAQLSRSVGSVHADVISVLVAGPVALLAAVSTIAALEVETRADALSVIRHLLRRRQRASSGGATESHGR